MRTRWFVLSGVLVAAACGGNNGSPPDAGSFPDGAAADLAATVDLAAPSDLASPPDLVRPPDLTWIPDLAHPPGADGGPASRMPVSGGCYRNNGDACESDTNCALGGCGNEVCHNPALGHPISTCNCVKPSDATCGCVGGICTWYK